jgi:hypothetical protein
MFLKPDGRFEKVMCEHAQRGLFMAGPEPGEGIGCLVVPLEDMVKLKTIELLLQFSNLAIQNPCGCSIRSCTTAGVGVSVAKAHPWKVVVGP